MANLKPEEYFKNEVDAAISQTGAKSTGSTPIRSSRLRFLETPGFDDKAGKDIPASVDFAGQNDRVIFLSMNKKGNVRMMTFRILNKEGTIAKPDEEIVSIDLDMDFPPVDLTDYVKKILGRKYEDILTEDPTKADQFIENFVTKSLNGGIKAFFVDKIEIVQTPWDPNTVPPQEVKKVEETPAATTTAPADQVTKVDDTTTPSDVSGVVPEVKKLPLRISIAGTDIKINAKTDLPSFYVFLGDGKVNGDELSEYDELDPEYTEGAFVGEADNVPEFPPEYLKMPDEPDEFKNWKPPGAATSSEDADLINTASGGTGAGDIKVPIIAKSMVKISNESEKETKNFHRLTLIREKTGTKGTQGTMYFNGKAIAKTLERPYISAKVKPHDGKIENENNRCIESGTYPVSLDTTKKSWLAQHYVKFTDSEVAKEKSPGVLPRINGVPGQSGIRIHAGGKMDDSLGCVLVSNNSTGEGRQTCEMETTKYITKLIYQYKLKEIKIIDEFLKSA
jgi:hypothetical protein